jgi:hypothetical protein
VEEGVMMLVRDRANGSGWHSEERPHLATQPSKWYRGVICQMPPMMLDGLGQEVRAFDLGAFLYSYRCRGGFGGLRAFGVHVERPD